MIRRVCFVTICSCLHSALTLSAAALYTVTDLGAGSAQGINSVGEVLATNSSGRPFLYLAGHQQILPQPLGGTFTAHGLNDLGQVAGYVNFSGALNYDLAIYSQGSLNIMTTLAGLDPFAINNAGQIAGDQVFTRQMFFYANGVATPIGALPGSIQSVARGLNAAGAAIGISSASGGSTQGFVYLNGQETPIPPPGGVSSTADAINNLGQIVGEYYPSSTNLRGGRLFLYSESGSRDLGVVLDPANEAAASSINDSGVIVGSAETISGPLAWIYTPETGFSDLDKDIVPNSGWSLFGASGINNAGQIVGSGLLDGQQHGFLLTPVPEPKPIVLVLFALIAVAGVSAKSKLRVNGNSSRPKYSVL
jgi:uncharacterized membrane protein